MALAIHHLVRAARVLLAFAVAIGLEVLVRRDASVALGLHGRVGLVRVRQALRLGRALLGVRHIDAAPALLLCLRVDAACAEPTSRVSSTFTLSSRGS